MIFRSFTHRIRKLMAYLTSWGNSEQEACAFYGKYWFENLTLFDLALTTDLDKIQVGLRHRANWLSTSISASKMAQKTCVTPHVCDFFMVTFCDLTLSSTFCKDALRTYAVSFLDIYPALWASLTSFCSPSNRPESPKGENTSLWHLTWPWPDTWP